MRTCYRTILAALAVLLIAATAWAEDVSVPAGQQMTVTADAASYGTVTRLSDVAGGPSQGYTEIDADSVTVFGPYAMPAFFKITNAAGVLTYVVAPAAAGSFESASLGLLTVDLLTLNGSTITSSAGMDFTPAPGETLSMNADAIQIGDSGATIDIGGNAASVTNINGSFYSNEVIGFEFVGLTAVNGAKAATVYSEEAITLATDGLVTDSSANLLPANSIIDAVVCRVTTTITTATDWAVGDPTTAARFSAANATLTAGTTSVGLDHMKGGVSTDATGPVQVAAAKLRITASGSNPGAGVVRCGVFARSFTAPTS